MIDQTDCEVYASRRAGSKQRVCRRPRRREKFHRNEFARETALINRLPSQVKLEFSIFPDLPCCIQ